MGTVRPSLNTPKIDAPQRQAPVEIERFVTELLTAWNIRDLDRVADFYAPSYTGIDVAQRAPHHGPQGVRHTLARYVRAFPDLRFRRERVISDGDCIAVAWVARGTHRGPLMKIPPTGRRIAVRGVSMLTLQNGMVTKGLHIWDVAGLLRALGLLPDL